MKEYKKALVALNLKGFVDELLLQKAKDLFGRFHTQLMLMHCLENYNCYAEAYGMMAGVDIEQILIRRMKAELKDEAEQQHLQNYQSVITSGHTPSIILELAKTNHCDLIIVGAAHASGWKSLFKTTTNLVIKHASCDVLVIQNGRIAA